MNALQRTALALVGTGLLLDMAWMVTSSPASAPVYHEAMAAALVGSLFLTVTVMAVAMLRSAITA